MSTISTEMIERAWRLYNDVDVMLKLVKSERKLRLFGVACCYEMWDLITDVRSRRAVEVAELFADGLASKEELGAAYGAAWGVAWDAAWGATWDAARGADRDTARDTARCAAMCAAVDADKGTAANIARAVRSVARRVATAQDANTARIWIRPMMVQIEILSDIVNPFFKGELTSGPTITGLATTIYGDRDYTLMPILGDALEDAGCTDPAVLGHCRSDKRHYQGCWVVDKILGRE